MEIDAGDTVWRFDDEFLRSRWTCIWGRGCHGIETERAAELGLGCCSVGAHIDGLDEARMVAASTAALRPEQFQHHAAAVEGGVFTDDECGNTRVVDGACIFLNRPGFSGGQGCALHLAALSAGESPVDWKPSVCWQLPVKVDWAMRNAHPGDDVEIATLRRWTRADWGPDGEIMAWCCTEGEEAYVGDHAVIDSLGEEIEAIVGTPVFIELRKKLGVTGTP
jgi:hypothetical protein